MIQKTKSTTFFIFIFIAFCINPLLGDDAITVTTYKLTKPQKIQSWFTATVSPSRISVFSFIHLGVVNYLKPIGSSFKARIIDTEGNIIQKGNLLTSQEPAQFEYQVKIDLAKVRAANADVHETRSEFIRSKKLYQKDAVSKKIYEQAIKKYQESLANLSSAEEQLKIDKYMLESCFVYAPFNGEVTEHQACIGAVKDKGKFVITVQELDHVKLTVELNQNITRALDPTHRIAVYPMSSQNPVGVFLTPENIKTHSIEFIITNFKTPTEQPDKNEEKLPKVNELLYVSQQIINNTPTLCIPAKCINKDKNGSFVWKAKGEKAFTPAKAISHTFEIEKIPVTLTGTMVQMPFGTYSLVKPSQDLSEHDVLIVNAPDGLKSGETILFQTLKWAFRPEEEVSIQIPALNVDKGYYFFSPAIYIDKKGQNYVYKYIKGTAQKVNVEVLKNTGYYSIIDSNELKTGDNLIMPINEEKIQDGTKVVSLENYQFEVAPIFTTQPVTNPQIEAGE
jgi:hypothetical protein